MDFNFWLGIIVAIPLSILANIFTPKFQKWLDHREHALSQKRAEEIRAELCRLKSYYENRSSFVEHLLSVILRTTLVTSVTGVASGLLYSFVQITDTVVGFREVPMFYAFAQLLSATGAFVSIRLCSPALRDAYRLRHFDEFESEMNALLSRPVDGLSENEPVTRRG